MITRTRRRSLRPMKYGPGYPERCASIDDARRMVTSFVSWYNTEHRHSGIGFLTPQMVSDGQAPGLVAARQQILDVSYAAHPERFVRGRPTAPVVPEAVWINPPLPKQCFGHSGGDSAAYADGRSGVKGLSRRSGP